MRSLLPIALNQVTTLVLGIAYVKLVNTFVPPAVNGPFGSFFITLSQLAAWVTHSGLVNHATRYWQRESGQRTAYAQFLVGASVSQIKLLAPILLVFCAVLSISRGEPVWIALWPLLVLCNFALALNGIAAGALNAEQSGWKFFFLNFAGTAARTFLTVGAALFAGVTLWMLSVGYTLHALVVIFCLVSLFHWAARGTPPDREQRDRWAQELRDYGRPFVVLGLGAWLLQSADRWVVAVFFDEHRAGIFNVAFGLAAIVPTMTMALLMQVSFPKIFQKSDQARTLDDWRRIATKCDYLTLASVGLSVAGLVALRLVAPFFVGPLISEEYVPALEMLVPAGLAVVAAQINQFQYLLLQGQHNSAAMVKVMMVVSGFKTLGSIVAAAISWPVLMAWLGISVVVAGVLGRYLIRRLALSERSVSST